jgi:endonuclease/exonuclease/phosphatase family metal-dependent hydrolase
LPWPVETVRMLMSCVCRKSATETVVRPSSLTHWPDECRRLDFLAPEGYHAVYRTNAYTRHGEHGNALLSRWPVLDHQHEDMSDHRLRAARPAACRSCWCTKASRCMWSWSPGPDPAEPVRQLAQLRRYIEREVPKDAPVLVAGDFNDWNTRAGRPESPNDRPARLCGSTAGDLPGTLAAGATGPCVRPGFASGQHMQVPRGRAWWRMSDHLPLIAEFSLPG